METEMIPKALKINDGWAWNAHVNASGHKKIKKCETCKTEANNFVNCVKDSLTQKCSYNATEEHSIWSLENQENSNFVLTDPRNQFSDLENL